MRAFAACASLNLLRVSESTSNRGCGGGRGGRNGFASGPLATVPESATVLSLTGPSREVPFGDDGAERAR